MTASNITLDNLGDTMFTAAKVKLGDKFTLVDSFLKDESDKLAITLRMIITAKREGTIKDEEAQILLNIQKTAVVSVLTAAEGMAAVIVQSAINAALQEVKDFVNGKIGFSLL